MLLRRGCLILALAAGLWAAIAALTGGITATLGPVRLSSRNPQNPALLAILALLGAWACAPPQRRISVLRADWLAIVTSWRRAASSVWRQLQGLESAATWGARRAAILSVLIAGAVMIVGLTRGALVAAGADASGYVTHARLWASGHLRVEQPLMDQLSGVVPREAFAPLAYAPAPGADAAIVPVTPPGLPMLMALFEIAAGPGAVYVVVPLLAGVAIVATYLLGSALGGPWAGFVAAALLAASPSFLFQLTSSPMSDIPAMAWWALSLAAVLRGGPRWLAGLSAAAAILTRPNLAPLAIFPAAMLAVEARTQHRRIGEWLPTLLAFTLPVAAAGATIAALHDYWFGSPLRAGYGAIDTLFRPEYLGANLARYPRWLVESQSPIVLLAALVPFLVRRTSSPRQLRARALLLQAFAAGVLACYLFYIPFDAWWFLRFLLPAYPPLLALTAVAVVLLARRLPQGLRLIAVATVVAGTAWHGVQYARTHAAFNVEGEWKYATAGRYVAERLPAKAVLLAMQHSGSVRYYADRPSLHYHWIPPDRLDRLVSALNDAGYAPYLLLEDWEEDDFRSRFPGQRTVKILEAAPDAEIAPGRVRLYRVP